MNTLPTDLTRLAERQHGLVTRAQLFGSGLTRSTCRTLVGRGTLERVGTHTLRFVGSPRTPHQQIMRVCLDLDAVASHRTSTALHRVGRFELMRPLEVVVRHDRQTARHPEATVHTSTWLPSDDIVTVHGIPTLGVARSLMSLAALPAVSDEALRGAVDEAVRDRKATDRWLCWRLEQVRCRGRNGVIRFEEVLTRRAGGEKTESWLEREFLRVLETAGVPLPVCQRRIRKRGIFLARVDFAFPGTNVVIEVSGNEHHATAAQRIQDAQRRNRLLLEGFQVLEFTYEDVVENPALVIATVRRALYDARAA